jgi:hypothetical protein
MRTTVVTALSIAGVVAAGALAAGANMRVFAGPDEPAPVGAAVAAEPPASGATSTGAGDAVPRDAIGVQTFQVGTAGTITLDAAGGLHLVGIDAAPGWRAEEEGAAAGRVVVTFEGRGDRDLTATARLAADGIHVTVTGEDEADDRVVDDGTDGVGIPAEHDDGAFDDADD